MVKTERCSEEYGDKVRLKPAASDMIEMFYCVRLVGDKEPL